MIVITGRAGVMHNLSVFLFNRGYRYPDHYEVQVYVDDDNLYHVSVTEKSPYVEIYASLFDNNIGYCL